jgi:hypothetical protein
MPFGRKRGYSDFLARNQVESMRRAAEFAHDIGYPLNLAISINWDRTWVGDDPDGRLLDQLMELSRKLFKRQWGVSVFAWIEVREYPKDPFPRPNAHVLVHCPEGRLEEYRAWVRQTLERFCSRLDAKAVKFKLVGNGNPTLAAVLGKANYMSKGVNPSAAARLGIRPSAQGRIHGKRAGVSQDIGLAAQRRHQAAARQAAWGVTVAVSGLRPPAPATLPTQLAA